MITIKGKYTTADVMIDNVEDECISQIMKFTNHPAFTNPVKIMPDTHAGKGSVIGFTMKLTDKVIASTIGVDIGCGVYATGFDKTPLDLPEVDALIRKHIPLGFSTNQNQKVDIETGFSWSGINQYASQFRDSYQKMTGIVIEPVDYSPEWYHDLLKLVGAKSGDVERSIGSLGGGNHFLEIAEGKENTYWLIVHTGSRNFGLRIANHFQKLAEEKCCQYDRDGYNVKLLQLKDQFKGRELGDKIRQLKVDSSLGVPKDLAYLIGQDAHDYFHAMIFAQAYANVNRRTISKTIFEKCLPAVIPETVVESVHNCIDFSDMIIRKGAIRSYRGEMMIVPFNMRDGSLIAYGKSNPDWNCSAPHGAGRVMSRTMAKKTLRLDEFRETMSGVYSTSVGKDTLDEAPDAYKPWTMIRDAVEPTMDIVDIIKPIYNLKAGGE